MRHMQRALFRAICGCAIATLALPTLCLAGGGGASSKMTSTVRIKNTSTAGGSAPAIGLSTVAVGDAGNMPLTIGSNNYGEVTTPFRIGTYEVTIQQYAAFLNSVATRPDTYSWGSAVIESLYDSRMATDTNVAGIKRTGLGNAGSPYVYTVIGDGERPIAYVNFLNAARFANWMHNEAISTADLEYGAYHIFGATTGTVTRSYSATWWIPTENEWFKAAYYKGGSSNAGYYTFPTKSDSLPGNSSNSAANQANFLRGGLYAITQLAALSGTENYLTPVGNFLNSPGPYGTFDQGGNVDEWTETTASTTNGIAYITRGGGWNTGGLNNDASPASTALPHDRSNKIGFRLARAASSGGAPPGLSGIFQVNVGTPTVAGTGRTVNPNAITQFSLRSGSFTVVATDVVDPSQTASATFNTSNKRRSFIEVKANSGVISITQVPAPGF